MAAAVVHKKEEIIIRHNDSASAEMTAIRVALEKVSETRDTITIHQVTILMKVETLLHQQLTILMKVETLTSPTIDNINEG